MIKAKKSRNSSIELLRIIAMILIIMSHYSVHGGFNYNSMPFGFNKILLHSVTLGSLGVDIFFIISGYFLSKSNFNFKKLLKLVFQVISYTLIIYIIFCIINPNIFSIRTLLKNTFPIIFEEYWFVSTYIILYLLSPYLNKLINHITEKEYNKLLNVMIFIWSILYTILSLFNFSFTSSSIFVDAIINAILMYFIGAYIRIYRNKINEKINKFCIKILSISSFILLLFTILSCKFDLGFSYIIALYHKNSIFIIIIAISLFIIMLNKNIYSKLINAIASCTFGVYLLHDNNYIRKILWHNILKNSMFENSNYLFLHFLGSILIVFGICTLIEYIRKLTIQNLGDKLIDKYSDRIKINKITNIINMRTKN